MEKSILKKTEGDAPLNASALMAQKSEEVPPKGDMPMETEPATRGLIIASESEMLEHLKESLIEPKVDQNISTKIKTKSLSGAGRKSNAHLKAKGLSHAEALELARKPIISRPLLSKRGRSEEESPKQSNPPKRGKNATKEKEDGGAQPGKTSKVEPGVSYKDVVKATSLAICSTEYPEVLLKNEILECIQAKIMDAMDELPIDGFPPTFAGCTKRRGWVKINCVDAQTEDWVKTLAPTLKVGTDITLKICKVEDLPQPQIFFLYLPNCLKEDNDKITRRLCLQNTCLRGKDWRILSRKDREEGYVMFTLSVGKKTAEALKALNNKITWMYGTAHFRPKKIKAHNVVSSGNIQRGGVLLLVSRL